MRPRGGEGGRIMGHIYVMSQLAERSNGIAVGLADGLEEGRNVSRESEI